ncbi:MAG: multicopper oxidase domain-containing protein [Anaerolineae bacterium]|nr:multicopper oxidase domain-containing protein [Anaerolineae bacterium]
MSSKDTLNLSRRQFLTAGAFAVAGFALPGLRVAASTTGGSEPNLKRLLAVPAIPGLSDPALQPKFTNPAPNALAPAFKFTSPNNKFKVAVGQTVQDVGLVAPDGITPLLTTVWGYGENGKGYTWPGRTFEVQQGTPIEVKWENKLLDAAGLPLPHLLPVDTSLHWAYSLPGYTQFSIATHGVPIVTHLHGGHTDSIYDGNPEYFFSPGYAVRGPRWVEKKYLYRNDQPAGTLWYHDHALGITRLNVYAGLAGFYIVRDAQDTGLPGNPLTLPAFPYELAYAIQDRMFKGTGELFYPAYPGDPFYDDFITGEGATLPPAQFPGGGPTALAEFFGDHMVVNGVIWPKADVEPRNYRLRLLNGCDSRFLVVRFRETAAGATDLSAAGAPIPFAVIGSDQGLASAATTTDTLVIGPGERYDVVFDFKTVTLGSRVIMENIGGDAPFGGDYGDALAPEDLFADRQTDRIMAFDVVLPFDAGRADDFDPARIAGYAGNAGDVTRIRKVALFEGMDEFGRLQPLLGTAEPEMDSMGMTVNGAITWHMPTTENPGLGATEIWEVYNATMDAHPVHLHLVHFEVLEREGFSAGVVSQPIMQHNGTMGTGYRLENIALDGNIEPATGVEKAPKDMVTAYPDQVVRIKATFDLPGRYVWHCHILSHEDHEMMRVLHVGPVAAGQ